MIYKYAWNAFKPGEIEHSLNELGQVGWRVVYMEWDERFEKYLVLVEKLEAGEKS